MEKKLNHSEIFRRVLSLALALTMLLSLAPVVPHVQAAGGTVVYLKPNDNWLMDNARFAVYYWNDGGSAWTDAADSNGDGYYEAEIPAGYSDMIFCRMNPAAAENDWANKWNQSGDLAVPTGAENCYTVPAGVWDGSDNSGWGMLSTGAGEAVTLRVWAPQEDQENENSFLFTACSQFAQAHPEWEISFVFEVMSEGEAGMQVAADPAAAADVYAYTNDQLLTLLDANALAPFTGDALAQIKAEISGNMLSSVSRDGKVYGVPYAGNTWFMYYDKSAYTEEDIQSLDAMMAKKTVAFPVSNSWYLPAFYFATGGAMYGDGTDAEAGITFGGDAGTAATLYIVNALAAGTLVNDSDGCGMNGLRDGTVGAIFSGSWDAANVQDVLGENFGVAQLPCITIDGEEKQLCSFYGSRAYGVNPNAGNLEAASALAAWLGSAGMQDLKYELRGILPACTEKYADDAMVAAQNNTIANTARLQPTIAEMGNYWGKASEMCWALVNGEINADNAAERTAAWNAALNGGSEPEVPDVPEASYYVAGDAALCGSEWSCDDPANQMTAFGDIYEKVYGNVPAGTYNLKVTDGTWNNSWGDNGQNYAFVVSEACDVTVTFVPDAGIVSVAGDHVSKVTTLDISAMYVVGNGSGAWLNGVAWNPGAAENAMTEVSDDVYEITIRNVPAGSAYEFKFAANGDWTHSWGSGGAEGEAVYNGQNLKLAVEYAMADVTLTLDMTGYDHGTKTGATYSVNVAEVEAEPVVDYYLIGYINGANYGCEEDYANLGEYKFVDGKLTATFAQDSYVFVKTGDNASWYMAEAYTAESPAVLKNTSTGTSEKLFVPGGVELNFTLEVGGDDTLTLRYAENEIPQGYTAVTIHFLKPETWGSTVNAYIWTGSGALAGYEANNVWPGASVSGNADFAGWYDLVVATANPTAFNFIFNDGGNQTADLYTGDVAGNTELWVVGNDVTDTAPGEWSGDYDYTATIHFQKPADWGETINAWIWDNAGNSIPGYEDYHTAWPGAPIEADAINAGWYSVAVTMDTEEGFNIILSDGSNQTADLATGTLAVKTELWVMDGAIQTAAPEDWVDPARTVHVPGTFPGPSWDAGSNQMTYDAELGLYVYTFKDVPAANYEFKISINSSWNENYGAGGVPGGANIAVTVPETMDVTIYYNDASHFAATSVDYRFLDVTLKGAGIPEGTALTDQSLSGIYAATVPMTAGTYSDIKLGCDGEEFSFASFELTEDKDVTFYFDPVSGIYYHDGSDAKVGEDAVIYDSQDKAYKSIYGAVATGEEVTFTIITGEDVTQAKLVVKGVDSFDMAQPEAVAYELNTKSWSCTVSFDSIGEYDYYFVLSNGSDVKVYGDDDGYYGTGVVTDLTEVLPYDLVVYEAGFETPDWMKNAVVYQIFPDRFFDGDESNNQAQTWARGEVDYEYITDWYTVPENPEQMEMLDKDAYLSSGAHYGDGEWSNEIYGGDLQGIIERVDYLKALGVNVIYLNPVFWSISNHRYDAVDYMQIDPILGTLGDFEQLVAVAEANDMHIILDGVFNHVSDDSVYFDRYYKFLGTSEKIGAYPYWAYVYDYMAENGAAQADAEAAARAYFSENYGITDYSYTEWFAVSSTTMAGTVDNIGLRAGKEVYSYEGWWGYDSMPVIYSTNGSEYQTGNWAEEIINGSNSVTQYWISKGNNGWRLDVANEVSDETWQRFRDSVKSLDSDAVIIGEIWDDATKYLMGNMYDSVMNYQFRNAVTSFAMGAASGDTTRAMEKIRERYPEEAFYAMMNLVGSHDTTRILSYLDGIGDDRSQKDFNSAFPTYAGTSELAKNRQYLVAFLQFTYAGAPTIYYGDEIGMVGADDPDDRRAFAWGKGNQELVEWYAGLAAIREAYPALRTGSVDPIDLGDSNVMGYVRRDEADTLIVLANNSSSARAVTLPEALQGEYVDLISGESFSGTVPALRGVILVKAENVKTVIVDTAGLAPAYDPAYTVAERAGGAEDAMLGDANGDGYIDNVDAMLILQYSVGLIDESKLDLSVCCVNDDEAVDNVDAMLILQYTVGLIDKFPVEE